MLLIEKIKEELNGRRYDIKKSKYYNDKADIVFEAHKNSRDKYFTLEDVSLNYSYDDKSLNHKEYLLDIKLNTDEEFGFSEREIIKRGFHNDRFENTQTMIDFVSRGIKGSELQELDYAFKNDLDVKQLGNWCLEHNLDYHQMREIRFAMRDRLNVKQIVDIISEYGINDHEVRKLSEALRFNDDTFVLGDKNIDLKNLTVAQMEYRFDNFFMAHGSNARYEAYLSVDYNFGTDGVINVLGGKNNLLDSEGGSYGSDLDDLMLKVNADVISLVLERILITENWLEKISHDDVWQLVEKSNFNMKEFEKNCSKYTVDSEDALGYRVYFDTVTYNDRYTGREIEDAAVPYYFLDILAYLDEFYQKIEMVSSGEAEYSDLVDLVIEQAVLVSDLEISNSRSKIDPVIYFGGEVLEIEKRQEVQQKM